MFGRLLVLFIVVPLVELYLLMKIASVISIPYTILLVVVTGITGAALARWQGWRTIQRIQQEMSSGKLPGEALLDALMIFVAGALLLTPGMLTDAVGLGLLIPPCRRAIGRLVRRSFEAHVQVYHQGNWTQAPGRSEVIDSYVIDREDETAGQDNTDPGECR